MTIRASKKDGRAEVIAYLAEQGYKVWLEPIKVDNKKLMHIVFEDVEAEKSEAKNKAERMNFYSEGRRNKL